MHAYKLKLSGKRMIGHRNIYSTYAYSPLHMFLNFLPQAVSPSERISVLMPKTRSLEPCPVMAMFA